MYSSVNTEQQTLILLAKGDQTATSNLYRQHYHVIRSWIIKNGGTEADSADIFQEAMMVLFGKAQSDDFKLTCSLGTYLFAISKHYWYKRVQTKHRVREVSYDTTVIDVEDIGLVNYQEDIKVHSEREMYYEQIDKALDQLGEPCRSILKAYYHHDKNMQEIAADFGYTNPENAKNQKYKCLARLKRIFFNVQ